MEKKLPTLGVVIPVFNEAEVLPGCLDRLLKQSGEISEILIVDNNSIDDSLAIAEQYAKKHEIIKVLQEKQQGIFPARNRGFMSLKSELAAKIDADTLVLPGWASSVRRYFVEHPEVAAISGPVYYHDLPFYKLTAHITDAVISGFNSKTSGGGNLYGPNMALRTHEAKKIAQNDCLRRGINEDMDTAIHLRDDGQLIDFCPEVRAEISGRRFLTGPIKYFRYCLGWPRAYLVHGKYWPAFTAYAATVFICLAQTLLVLPLRAYNPKTKKFSFSHLINYKNQRTIPHE